MFNEMKNISVLKKVVVLIVVLLLHSSIAIAQEEFTAQKDWQKIELDGFSFYLPPELKPREVRGRESAVWIFTSQNLELLIILGPFLPEPSSFQNEANYKAKNVSIDGKKAITFFYKDDEDDEENRPLVAAVHFPRFYQTNDTLIFSANCRSRKEKKLAKKIFLSIKFG